MNMSFSDALNWAKEGETITRELWPDSSLRITNGVLYIFSSSASAEWRPTSADLLAEDWMLVGK